MPNLALAIEAVSWVGAVPCGVSHFIAVETLNLTVRLVVVGTALSRIVVVACTARLASGLVVCPSSWLPTVLLDVTLLAAVVTGPRFSPALISLSILTTSSLSSSVLLLCC